MTKKGIVIFATSAVLAATVAIGGTIAYFSSSATAKNTFTVGNVKISMDEAEVEKTETNSFVTTSSRVTANSYENIYPGAELPKDPTITVKADSQNCYVGMVVSIDNYEGFSDAAQDFFDDYFATIDYQDGWKCVSHEDGKYILNYEKIVTNSSEDTIIDPAFEEIDIPTSFTSEDMESLGEFNMDILGQAIQAQGFDSADLALEELNK